MLATNRPSSKISPGQQPAGRGPAGQRAGRLRQAERERAMSETAAESADEAPRSGTRSRIQAVAIELFSEQGYDKTSLREIAERLDVTKAALYYHFRSKEDIVRSLLDDYFAQLDSLTGWAKAQPRTPAVRAEILTRYIDMVIESHQIYRMLQQNQAALATLA